MTVPVIITPVKAATVVGISSGAGACPSQLVTLMVRKPRQAAATRISMVTAFAGGVRPERFRDLCDQVAEVSEQICRLRPFLPDREADGDGAPSATEGKRGVRRRIARKGAAELGKRSG